MDIDSHNEKVIANIRLEARKLDMRAKGAMEYVMLQLQKPVKAECPVDQGLLRASISYTVEMDREGVTGTLGILSGRSSEGVSVGEYAIYVHQGTGIYASNGGRKTPWMYKVSSGKYAGVHITQGQKANPFFRRAYQQNRNNINDWFNRGFVL